MFSRLIIWYQSEIELLKSTTLKDAYSSVGGLDKQIQQIRDLLEIPLTRPELFKHLGLCSLSLRGFI